MPIDHRSLKSRALATVAACAVCLPAIAMPAPAQAQALQPVVDVCTGISLDQSALRDILSDTVVPTAQGLESVFNSLLGVTLLVPPLLSLSPLQLGIAQTTQSLANGDPISLSVLDQNGFAVAPGDCNLTVDGIALNTPAGLAIGGNQITGLGQGTPAVAEELDAIAFGNGAIADVGATGAVALGAGANVSVANGVALGAGSQNTRGPLASYTAPGIVGTVSSAGSVSVGAPGAERQITNVAPGTAPNDAATVGQLTGAIAAATADSVRYDDASRAVVTLGGGAGGTRITNLAAGTLDPASSDAVNGSQLFATNQQVAANGTGIATNAGAIAALDAAAVKYDDAGRGTVTFAGTGGTRLTNLTDGTVSATSTDAVTGAQLFAVTQAVAAVTGSPGLALTYDDSSLGRATLGGSGGTVIGNLADGAVAAGSSEAVNGGQLFATNQQVAGNTTAIANIDARVTSNTQSLTALGDSVVAIDARVAGNTTSITALQAQIDNVPVGYVADADGTTPSAVATDTAAFASASGGPVRVTNVAAGTLDASSTDAVNGAQLAATNAAVAANRADIVTISATIGAGSAAPLQYSDAATPTVANGGRPSQDVTLIGADGSAPVRLHNVAAGTAATDAPNVGQVRDGLAVLQQSIDRASADARAYVDGRIADLRFDLSQTREDAFSGTAAAMAMASIPQTMDPDRSVIGGSVGHYRGETAFGFGVSTATDEGRIVFRASGTIDTRGKGGIAAGAGFSF